MIPAQDLLNWLSIASSITGVVLFFKEVFLFIQNKLNNRLSYKELLKIHSRLLDKIQESFNFEIVLIVNIHGFLLPNFIYNRLKNKIIYHIYCFDESSDKNNLKKSYSEMKCIETDKWIMFLPKLTKNLRKKKILILDDVCLSGNSLKRIKDFYTVEAVKSIKTASLYVTDVCKTNNLVPDYYDSIAKPNLKTPYDKIR